MAQEHDLKEQQNDQWGDAAGSWERFGGWFQAQTKPLTDWMVDATHLGPGSRVLDLALWGGSARAHGGGASASWRHGRRDYLAPEMVEVVAGRPQRRG